MKDEDREIAAERQGIIASRTPREQTIIVTGEDGKPVERTFWTDAHVR
jgi:hypothetical protein